MKAYVLHNINDLRYEDISMPDCPHGWAIVKVKAAGICSSDIARVFTKGTYHFPTIPGHEFSGIVYSVSDDSDKHWIGKHVGVFPLIPCNKCDQCEKKHYEMCEHYDYLGSRRDGGFAEYVAVPIWNLIEIPTTLNLTHVAMLEPLSVALHAIKRGEIKQDDNVAIIGTGMIGISAGQWALLQGAASVTVIGRSEAKRSIIENCGLHYMSQEGKESQRTYDFVLEAVGSPSAIDKAINAVSPGGTLLLMGNPTGNIELNQNTYWRILRKQLTIKGTWNSFYDNVNVSDWTEVIDAIIKKKINVASLITHTYKQDNLIDGLSLMQKHKEPYCKVMTIWNE